MFGGAHVWCKSRRGWTKTGRNVSNQTLMIMPRLRRSVFVVTQWAAVSLTSNGCTGEVLEGMSDSRDADDAKDEGDEADATGKDDAHDTNTETADAGHDGAETEDDDTGSDDHGDDSGGSDPTSDETGDVDTGTGSSSDTDTGTGNDGSGGDVDDTETGDDTGTADTETDTSTDATDTDPDTGEDATDTGDTQTGDDAGTDTDTDDDTGTDTTDSGDDDVDEPECGNGVVEAPEVCDDGNTVTEVGPHAVTACSDACDLLLKSCGNGTLDPGEECDDGNADSSDACTTSCTLRVGGYHDPCTCESGCSDSDPTAGVIVGCDQVVVPTGALLACFRSGALVGPAVESHAEGECGILTQKCVGDVWCSAPIGDYAAHVACPAPMVFVERRIERLLEGYVWRKTCRKPCESDSDCRWNAYDEFWVEPGQYRCIEDAEAGAKFCEDARNAI